MLSFLYQFHFTTLLYAYLIICLYLKRSHLQVNVLPVHMASFSFWGLSWFISLHCYRKLQQSHLWAHYYFTYFQESSHCGSCSCYKWSIFSFEGILVFHLLVLSLSYVTHTAIMTFLSFSPGRNSGNLFQELVTSFMHCL